MDSMSWLMDETTDEFSKVMSTVETRTGRSFATHAYTSEEEAVELCDRLGLHVEVRPQIDGSFELSGGSRKLPPAILHRLEQTLKIWEMRRVHRK
jgi:hypothetical protein